MTDDSYVVQIAQGNVIPEQWRAVAESTEENLGEHMFTVCISRHPARTIRLMHGGDEIAVWKGPLL